MPGGLATAATTFMLGPQAALAGKHDYARPGKSHWKDRGRHKSRINFEPVTLAEGNGPVPVISPDYSYDVLIPWGDPLQPGGPVFNYPPNSADQALQVGIGHDGMTFFPFRRGKLGQKSNSHGLLAINHEFGSNDHVLGKPYPESLEDVRTSQHAHGVGIVEIKQRRGQWQTVNSRFARRIHVNTPVAFSGPVAGSALLENPAGNEPQGTVNNCANGETPWGTYLTCEENFNGYFGATGDWNATVEDLRYGLTPFGFGYGWHEYDARFDLSNDDYRNEKHRFGWVVEIDPMDPTARPVKRTALGRFKHEGAEMTVGLGGRVVVYMGDDERFDYIYKFVSARNWKVMRAQGISPLDEGALFVARFNDDGSGEWLELTIDNPALAAVFSDQAEVLTFARKAADILGATKMDRPEWTSVGPDGSVYCTLTNNSRRTVADGPNPLAPNFDGHIIRWRDSMRHIGRRFHWDIFLIAENTHGTEESFSSPDGIWADPEGRVFIQTDGGQKDGLNNQMLVADARTGEIRRLLTGVTDDEITGIATTPDRKTLFVNIQHPGNGNPAVTNFPAPQDGVTIPRDCTLVIRRKDGGVIGS